MKTILIYTAIGSIYLGINPYLEAKDITYKTPILQFNDETYKEDMLEEQHLKENSSKELNNRYGCNKIVDPDCK
jgi:hypothetical protein